MSAVSRHEEVCTVLEVHVRGKGKVWERRVSFDAPVAELRAAREEQGRVTKEWETTLEVDRGGGH